MRKETVKQIRGLIVFTALLIVCLWKYDVVMDAFRFVLNILYPFQRRIISAWRCDCIRLKRSDEFCGKKIIHGEKVS